MLMRITVTSGQAELSVETLSEGPIRAVALHAGVADRRSYIPLARAMQGTLGITAYDRRGFGEMHYAAEPHRHVDDLTEVLDATVGDEPVWLIGNSQGGRVAVDLALATPERVRGLVLIAPALSGEPDDIEMDDATTALSDAIDEAEERGDLSAVNHLEAHAWLDGPNAPEGRVGGELRALFLDMNRLALNALDPGEELPPPVADAARRLHELRQPTLVLVGDLDLAHVQARCRQIAAEAPDAQLVLIDGCAHLPQLEQPEQVAAALRSFLRRTG